jgi:hypothetical protein
MKCIRAFATVILTFAATSGVSAAATLSQVFTFAMLDAQVPYLEHLVGPAMHVSPGSKGAQLRDYEVQGCHVIATVASKAPGLRSIQALSLDLSPRCNFDLTAFRLSPLSTRDLTISKVPFWNSLDFEADCISLCGNAADPTVDFIQQSSHASNWVAVIYTITVASNQSVTASEALRETIQASEGEDYVTNTKFNCNAKYGPLALRLFANIPVNRITIGLFPGDAGGRCQ